MKFFGIQGEIFENGDFGAVFEKYPPKFLLAFEISGNEASPTCIFPLYGLQHKKDINNRRKKII